MENKFKRTFQLKQHTPLIHFQHGQEGATLRATELKPKLDRFIMDEEFGFKFDNYKNLLVGYNGKAREKDIKKALDYKVSIKATGVKYYDIPNFGGSRGRGFPNFFANMGDDWKKNPKKFSWTDEAITVEFFSLNKTILDTIEKKFPDFLMFHNFGMRQSKGFGSFFLHAKDGKEQRKFNDMFAENTDCRFKVRPKQQQRFDEQLRKVFEDMELFYKTLRGGINLKRGKDNTLFYFKSLLFLYAKEELGFQWEKKSIKDEYFNAQASGDKLPKKLMKDLLGLSTEEQWLAQRVKITKENPKIDRFKSPIVFKPIKTAPNEYTVYFFVDLTEADIFNQSFTIKSNGRGKLKLTTPTEEEFDYYDFLDFVCDPDVFNIEEHVERHFHSTYQYRTLKNIYEQLQSYA